MRDKIPLAKLVYACPRVVLERKTCKVVFHCSNGDFEFLCGSNDHGVEGSAEENPIILHFNHLLEFDPTLEEIRDLKVGFEANRQEKGGIWSINPLSPEDDEF